MTSASPSNWISVKDALPTERGQYLVVIRDQWDTSIRYITFDRWDGKNWDVSRDWGFWTPVTHWMECPELNTQAANTSNWISVKDALPLAPGQYMAVIQNQWDPRTSSITSDRWDGKNWDVSREYTFWCPVTHWMELPELPNK